MYLYSNGFTVKKKKNKVLHKQFTTADFWMKNNVLVDLTHKIGLEFKRLLLRSLVYVG